MVAYGPGKSDVKSRIFNPFSGPAMLFLSICNSKTFRGKASEIPRSEAYFYVRCSDEG
jgi:hypothetical protein